MDFVSRANGGIFEAELRLHQTLQADLGVGVQVVGLRDAHSESDRERWKPLNPSVQEVCGPRSFGYAPGLVDALLHSGADLAYCAGLWKYPSAAALSWANRTRKPMIVAPHGMLDPWALRHSRVKKGIAGLLFQNSQLRKAACLRALSLAEAESFHSYGLKNPICVIPNGIDLPPLSETTRDDVLGNLAGGPKVLLYLGRIHPKKGLANLLRAWASLLRNKDQVATDWILAIAGWDQGDHENELKRLATELGIRWNTADCSKPENGSLLFLGSRFGKEKASAYFFSDAFILPSLSEGLPMVILEAWSYAKPVLMTPECNLPEGFEANAAIPIDATHSGIAAGLKQLGEMTDYQRTDMGRRGRDLVARRFNWSTVASQTHNLYDWVLGGGTPPDCLIR